MRLLVDASVWSLALRRAEAQPVPEVRALEAAIGEGRVVMVGPVRQELLSGVKGAAQFRRLEAALDAFPDEPLESDDFVEAARCFNRCRARGIQGSNTDLLLCAVALRRELEILTTDADFQSYARVLKVKIARRSPG